MLENIRESGLGEGSQWWGTRRRIWEVTFGDKAVIFLLVTRPLTCSDKEDLITQLCASLCASDMHTRCECLGSKGQVRLPACR